jgi:antitoxin PrlF
MSIVTVSEKGQVVIPAAIRKQLGITPGCQLDFSLEAGSIRVQVKRQVVPSTIDEGFGLLVCKKPGKRSLRTFDVAAAMRGTSHDRD